MAYAEKYRIDFKSLDGNDCRVGFWFDGYGGMLLGLLLGLLGLLLGMLGLLGMLELLGMLLGMLLGLLGMLLGLLGMLGMLLIKKCK